jgi:hypothetical protein
MHMGDVVFRIRCHDGEARGFSHVMFKLPLASWAALCNVGVCGSAGECVHCALGKCGGVWECGGVCALCNVGVWGSAGECVGVWEE